MLLWFVGGSWLIVWSVLQDPAVDYRLVMAGALLPDVVDAPWGGARYAHTLVFAAALLVAVMLLTVGHRRARRRLLGLPIGVLVHLVLDGLWTTPHAFWWPFKGWALAGRLPSLQHAVVVTVLEEVAGAIAIIWCVRRFALTDPARRMTFLRTGRVGRDLVG
jgi:membrane-bound metal-dependent hydrolase YbcI (DUF457 family)